MSLRSTTQHLEGHPEDYPEPEYLAHKAPGRENGIYTKPISHDQGSLSQPHEGTPNGHSSDCFFYLNTKKDATTMRYNMVVPACQRQPAKREVCCPRGALRRT